MTYSLSQADLARCRNISRSHRALVIDIVQAVAEASGVPAPKIMGVHRDATTSRARWLVCYLAHVEEGLTLQEIGQVLRKHHTSILYGVQKERERRMDKAPE